MANSIVSNAQPNLKQEIMEFSQTIQGDPKQAVMQFIATRGIPQAQLNQVMQMANQIVGSMK